MMLTEASHTFVNTRIVAVHRLLGKVAGRERYGGPLVSRRVQRAHGRDLPAAAAAAAPVAQQ